MATTPFREVGTMNGATAVTLVTAPDTSEQKVIKSLLICNIDTASVILNAYIDANGSLRYLVNSKTLAVNETIDLVPQGGILVLTETTDTIKAVLSGAVTTNQPTFYANGVKNS